MPRRVTAAILLVTALGMTACGSRPAPGTLLSDARRAFDSAQSVHFDLTSSNAKGSGTLLTGASGDALRPDHFAGTLSVSISGLAVHVKVVSTGGTFYVQLPFTTTWQVATPQQYGFGDPAQLLNKDQGLSSLLSLARNTADAGQDRYNGELLDEVSCTLPGADVARLLTSADPAQDDKATFGIDDSTHELRRVVITGPFFVKGTDSVFTLILDNYGENVHITPPAVASATPGG